jgi:hypothetical protein
MVYLYLPLLKSLTNSITHYFYKLSLLKEKE